MATAPKKQDRCAGCGLRFTRAQTAHLVSCTRCAWPMAQFANPEQIVGVHLSTPEPVNDPLPNRGRDLAPGPRPMRVPAITDIHLRLLRRIARHHHRALDEHDANDHALNPGSSRRRQQLQHVAERADTHVTQAKARRQSAGNCSP